MKFAKDILIFDFESTTGNPEIAQPTQLGAILLDKETLEEKNHYLSYIAADLSDCDPKILAISGITQEDLQGAPEANEVIRDFVKKFGTNVILSSWVEYLDRRLLMNMLRNAGVEEKFDYHYLDLWPLAYAYLAKHGQAEAMNSETIFNTFGMPKRNAHDALEDCRLEAEILRKIMSRN